MSHVPVLSSADGNNNNRTAIDACSVFSLSSFPIARCHSLLMSLEPRLLVLKVEDIMPAETAERQSIAITDLSCRFPGKAMIWQAFGSPFVPESVCLPHSKFALCERPMMSSPIGVVQGPS